MTPDWFQDWSGEVCAIVASGPSVTPEAVASLRGRCRVAVVNNGYQLAPWADLLYAADGKWWDHHVAARAFAGLKVTPDKAAAKRYGLQLIDLVSESDGEAATITTEKPGLLGHGGNSAFQLVNLVTQFGARRQIWIGFDFCGEHWHGKHDEPLKNPRPQTLTKWCDRIDAQAKVLTRLGVEVLNASSVSTLTAYPKCSVAEAIGRMDRKQPEIDFDAAALFVEEARKAHNLGDHAKCLASRKLVAVALNLTDEPRVRLRTSHLRSA